MAANTKKKPRNPKKRPVFSQRFRVSSIHRQSKRKQAAQTHVVGEKRLPRRDKYGRFVKTNRLGTAKRLPPPRRDKYGRFVSSAHRSIKRDKKGRFVKSAPVWYRRRIATALVAIILGTSGAVYFGLQLNKTIAIEKPVAASSTSAPAKPTDTQVVVTLPKSEPTRLRISKIKVDTSFVSIGKKTDGTMEIPKSYDMVGWYKLGPTPGELGPAVVVGHVDRPGDVAVFWRLRELVPGDTFEIDRADGSTAKFKVDAVKQVPQSNFPTEEVYGNIDFAGIRLITCGGTFNRTTRHYSDNTIVFGSLITDNKPANSTSQ